MPSKRRMANCRTQLADKVTHLMAETGLQEVDCSVDKDDGAVKIIRRRRLEDGQVNKLKGMALDAKDSMFDSSWTRINGEAGSGTYYVVDADSSNVRLAVKVRLFRDMSASEREEYQEVATYLRTDCNLHGPILSNGSAVKGHGRMYGIGFRPGYERVRVFPKHGSGRRAVTESVLLGNYAPKKSTSFEQWMQARKSDIRLHEIFGQHFKSMVPRIFEGVQQRAIVDGLPLFGLGAPDYHAQHVMPSTIESSPNTNDSTSYLFSPNMAYTFDRFWNKQHRDNDSEPVVFGLFMPIDKNFSLCSRRSGYQQYHGHFCVSQYQVLVDTAHIDGVIEILWHGSEDLHGTTRSTWKRPGDSVLGSSCQVNTSLYQRVQRGLKDAAQGRRRVILTDAVRESITAEQQQGMHLQVNGE